MPISELNEACWFVLVLALRLLYGPVGDIPFCFVSFRYKYRFNLAWVYAGIRRLKNVLGYLY